MWPLIVFLLHMSAVSVVRPQVKVSGQEKGHNFDFFCHIDGFLPRAVDVKWMKNKEDEVHSYETTHVLPNPDGTYQIRVSAEVTPKDGDRFFFNVDQRSLKEPPNTEWVWPQVKASDQEKVDTVKFICKIVGFHPRAVDVTRMKNKEDEVHSYETTHVLPNPDGTNQIRVSGEVTPKTGDRFFFNVDHSSLKEPLNTEWASDTSSDPSNPASA